MRKSTLAILLALYNGETYLREQIDSILQQTFTEWKLYIRDDGSSDQSLMIVQEYISRYPEKIVLIEDGDQRIGATLNFSRLGEQCDEPYLMFCDQDDVWMEHKIETSYRAIRELEADFPHTPALVFSDLELVDKELNTLALSFWKNQKLDPEISTDLYSILAQNVVTGCTVMINRSLAQLSFPIPTQHIVHDHWLAIMACRYGKVAAIKEPLVLYRQHGENVFGAPRIGWKYFAAQLVKLFFEFRNYREKYVFLPFKVNGWKILYQKIVLNVQRIMG